MDSGGNLELVSLTPFSVSYSQYVTKYDTLR